MSLVVGPGSSLQWLASLSKGTLPHLCLISLVGVTSGGLSQVLGVP